MKSIRLFVGMSIVLLATMTTVAVAYDDRAIYTHDNYRSEDLNLDAVASLFGTSRDLADFEQRLNDPSYQISNLDLNRDYQVDYLRVVERIQGDLRVITIQAVLGYKHYQDIATIEMYRDYHNRITVQIIGDPYIYGRNFIVEPRYNYIPALYSYFWTTSHYKPYYSRYNWNSYPKYYHTWKRRTPKLYHNHIYRHVDEKNSYIYTKQRGYTHRDSRDKTNTQYNKEYQNHNYSNHSKTTQTIQSNRTPNYNQTKTVNTTSRSSRSYDSSQTAQEIDQNSRTPRDYTEKR